VDVHVPGCPPRPEAVMYGILKLRDQIQAKPDLGWRARYDAGSTIEVLGTEGVPGGGGSITTLQNGAERKRAAEDAAIRAAREAAPGLAVPPAQTAVAHGNSRA
ncbi:MAG: hypothetical protein AAGC46_00870, partial [Solirubrobacteraceae bacterium]